MESSHAGPGGVLEVPLAVLEEVMAVGPRLASRTRRQVAVVRRLGAHLPCVGRVVAPREEVRIPAREAPERITVLDVLADGPPQPDLPVPVDEGVDVSAVPVPGQDELPVPEYDSLAASQVVPRLATLDRADLELVGAYERAHRNRQTILHRVAQLLAAE